MENKSEECAGHVQGMCDQDVREHATGNPTNWL